MIAMHTLDHVIVALNIACAFVAFVANLYGARHDDPRKRPVRAAIATIAAIYVFAYLWLYTDRVDRQSWSEVMSGVSLVVWPVVWGFPPVWSAHLYHVDRRRADEIVNVDGSP